MGEATITSKVRDLCKELKKTYKGFLWWKISDRYTSGKLDFWVAYQGRDAFIELKDVGEKPDPLQRYEMTELSRAKIRNMWSDNYEEVEEYIYKEVLRVSRKTNQ